MCIRDSEGARNRHWPFSVAVRPQSLLMLQGKTYSRLSFCALSAIPYWPYRPSAYLRAGATLSANLSPLFKLRVQYLHPSPKRTRAADRLLLGVRDAAPEVCLLYTSPSPRDRTRS